MTRPKAEQNSPNPRIDRLLNKAMSLVEAGGEDSTNIDTILDVVKTAAAWEKIKHGIKDDDEGTFFDEDEK